MCYIYTNVDLLRHFFSAMHNKHIDRYWNDNSAEINGNIITRMHCLFYYTVYRSIHNHKHLPPAMMSKQSTGRSTKYTRMTRSTLNIIKKYPFNV